MAGAVRSGAVAVRGRAQDQRRHQRGARRTAIKDKLAATGYVAEGSSPEELAKLLRAEIAKWSAVIKSVGIKID